MNKVIQEHIKSLLVVVLVLMVSLASDTTFLLCAGLLALCLLASVAALAESAAKA